MTRLLRKKIMGVDADDVAETEADHFGNCPVCGTYLDMRNLGQMLAQTTASEGRIAFCRPG